MKYVLVYWECSRSCSIIGVFSSKYKVGKAKKEFKARLIKEHGETIGQSEYKGVYTHQIQEDVLMAEEDT